MNRNKVVVGMSGGVDSSVAAYLLKKQGYEVIGITMQVWPDVPNDETYSRIDGCCSLSSVEDARKVANKLEIPFYVLNFKDIFEKKVIDYFVSTYIQGKTPNPCIACNRYIKFDELLRRAHSLDAFYVATGHYACIGKNDSDKYFLKKSNFADKDQTYALYHMTQYQLEHTLMPIGSFSKKVVRSIAAEIGLDIADKPDSQEICFIDDNNYSRFIQDKNPGVSKAGDFIDVDGNILGLHRGIIHYTIGQRKGFGITFGSPMYVVSIQPEDNTVTLGTSDDIFHNTLWMEDIHFINEDHIKYPLRLQGKIRYHAHEAWATLYPSDSDQYKIVFDQPQRAITPGQAIVLYDGELVFGGGTITKVAPRATCQGLSYLF